MNSLGPGSEIDGFRLGEMIHAGSMASIYRLTGRDGPLPLIIKIPRLGPGERAVAHGEQAAVKQHHRLALPALQPSELRIRSAVHGVLRRARDPRPGVRPGGRGDHDAA